MEKELKFRAWDTDKGEWVYLPETGYIELMQDDQIEFDYDKERIKISQFIGLKDKNDKEIYGEDIAKTIFTTFEVVNNGYEFYLKDTKSYEGKSNFIKRFHIDEDDYLTARRTAHGITVERFWRKDFRADKPLDFILFHNDGRVLKNGNVLLTKQIEVGNE